MKYCVLWILTAVIPVCVNAQMAIVKDPSDARSVIARAIGWYGQWHTDGGMLGTQKCSGRRSGDTFVLTCLPIDVVIRVEADEDRDCNIHFIRHGGGVPSLVASGTKKSRSRLRHCSGLPDSEGDFTLESEGTPSEVDPDLTRRAHAAATRYLRLWPEDWIAYFPRVRSGDPFFHVYIVRGGILDVVLQFRIIRGVPEDFSHWDYTKRRGGFPQGSVNRLSSPDLWFSVERIGPGTGR